MIFCQCQPEISQISLPTYLPTMNCIWFTMIDSEVLVQIKVQGGRNICPVSINAKKMQKNCKQWNNLLKYVVVWTKIDFRIFPVFSTTFSHRWPMDYSLHFLQDLGRNISILLKLEGTVIYGPSPISWGVLQPLVKAFFCLQGEQDQYNDFVDAIFFISVCSLVTFQKNQTN